MKTKNKDIDKLELEDKYFDKKETWEFYQKFKSQGGKATATMKDFVLKLGTEAKETKEASKVIVKFLKEGKVSKEEEHELRTQIYDLFKMAGIGVPFMLIPGSTLLLPYLIKKADKLGIDLIPTAFKKEKEKKAEE